MDEKWLPVKGFRDYEVSSYGRVRSKHIGTKAKLESDGYSYLTPQTWGHRAIVVLAKNDIKTTVSLGAIVAEAFMGKRPPNTLLIHKDFNVENCCADNLEYADGKRYYQHIIDRQARAGRDKGRKEEQQRLQERRCRSAQLAQAVIEYESMNPKSLPTIATKYGIDPSYLSFLKNGKRSPKFFKEEYNRLVANH